MGSDSPEKLEKQESQNPACVTAGALFFSSLRKLVEKLGNSNEWDETSG
jgi:hypothetical protein